MEGWATMPLCVYIKAIQRMSERSNDQREIYTYLV
jgi:hypothetical protein